MKHGTLVLVRHGESRLNELNRFSGWIDVPLTELGIREAQACRKHCKQFDFDSVFTSNLERAHETLLIILSSQHRIGIFEHKEDKRYNSLSKLPKWFTNETLPIFFDEALNERYYGDLQGINKNQANKLFGKAQVLKWRRGFTTRPPKGESLKDVYERVIPYFEKNIHPRLKKGETVMISGHGNTLRAVIKYLEKIEDEQIPFVDLPTGKPLVYECVKNIFNRVDGEYQFNRPLR